MSIVKISNNLLDSVTPYAHYKMNDDLATTVVVDDGTGSHNGTADANTSTLTTTGKINDALDFDGTEKVNIDTLAVAVTDDTTGSISVWARMDDATNNEQHIISFSNASAGAGSEAYFALSFGGTPDFQVSAMVRGVSGTGDALVYCHTPRELSINNWYHIVLVQDGTAPKIYINGVSKSITYYTETDKGAWFNDIVTNDFDTGRLGTINIYGGGDIKFLTGKIDDVRYYQNYALTSDEVSILYNSGNGTENNIKGISKFMNVSKASISKVSGISIT